MFAGFPFQQVFTDLSPSCRPMTAVLEREVLLGAGSSGELRDQSTRSGTAASVPEAFDSPRRHLGYHLPHLMPSSGDTIQRGTASVGVSLLFTNPRICRTRWYLKGVVCLTTPDPPPTPVGCRRSRFPNRNHHPSGDEQTAA